MHSVLPKLFTNANNYFSLAPPLAGTLLSWFRQYTRVKSAKQLAKECWSFLHALNWRLETLHGRYESSQGHIQRQTTNTIQTSRDLITVGSEILEEVIKTMQPEQTVSLVVPLYISSASSWPSDN